jgi:hypothetical protein
VSTSPILDVVIGLVFFFCALSLVTSSIEERISAVAGLRARGLEAWITKNLGAEQAKRFYEHPLIAGLGGTTASYISSQTFATALLDTCGVAPAQPAVAAAVADPLRQQAIADSIRKTLTDLPKVPVSAALLAHFDHAQGSITRARAGLETWFDDAMQRLSGAYKRRIHWYLLAIATSLILAINGDTLRVARVLYRDPVVRAAFAEQARAAGQKGAAAGDDVKTLVAGLPLPIGWAGDSAAPGATVPWLLEKILGVLLTVAAVSLGAPFWFDVLNQFVNLRAAGDKPASTSSDPVPGS